jgi:hypothetical protein
MTALFDEWMTERDPEKFFNAVINDREKAHAMMDTCKEVNQLSTISYQTTNPFVSLCVKTAIISVLCRINCNQKW